MFVVSLLIGLLMLVGGAELLVRGGGQLALALRVPALVVGLTVVAFGTSMPELTVSVTAALQASTEMALANVNGSNLANVALVLGAAALVHPLAVERTLLRREVPACLILQLMVPALAMDGTIGFLDGLLLLSGGVGYNAWLLYEAMQGRFAPPEDDELEEEGTPFKNFGMLIGGILILVVGANLFVTGAEAVALAMGMSPRFIGLSVVALGTSAPEMATAVVSARRGEVDLAVGNSIGSNLLNISMVLGITSMIAPIHIVDSAAWNDMGVAVLATALLIPIVLKGVLNRLEGGLFIAGYCTYMFSGFLLS